MRMTLRDQAIREHPDFPWLDSSDPRGVETLMRRLGWLEPDESIDSCVVAGPGNMNLTLKVRTPRRESVLKQARPWVEKFDHIPAPWDRTSNEIAFYRAVANFPAVQSRMPRLLEFDEASHTLLLEYVPGDGDFSDLYSGDRGEAADANQVPGRFCESDLHCVADFLANLHVASSTHAIDRIPNRDMRALNFNHIFEIPLRDDSGIDLDSLAPELAKGAERLRRDRDYRAIVSETGREYLADGEVLLHGDFFPGSWLRTSDGLRVIDPEFCFHGAPEFDLGCVIAHFALARLPIELSRGLLARYRSQVSGIALRDGWIARYAGVEVMRRLIGVAQLPIPVEKRVRPSEVVAPFRTALLERSRSAMLNEDFEHLWQATSSPNSIMDPDQVVG